MYFFSRPFESKEKGKTGRKKNTHKEESVVPILEKKKNSKAQDCKLLTDFNFTIYLPKLSHLESLPTLGFIFEFFDGFKLQDNQRGNL
jgi:hypothetical protein